MTVLHRRFESDDRPLITPSEAETWALARAPDIVSELIWPPVIIEDFDVPDFGGSSVPPGSPGSQGQKREVKPYAGSQGQKREVQIFIDRAVARRRPILKRTKLTFEQWRSAVALHEQFENILHYGRKMEYELAHGFATVLEHMFVRGILQVDPELYEEDLSEFITGAEGEDIKCPPPELACFPYYDSPDARDLKILNRLAQLGVKDAQHPGEKIDHAAAQYGRGKADGEHCGNCIHWIDPQCAVVQEPMTYGVLGWSRLWSANK